MQVWGAGGGIVEAKGNLLGWGNAQQLEQDVGGSLGGVQGNVWGLEESVGAGLGFGG